jgi:Ca-activated chloride channel family protein
MFRSITVFILTFLVVGAVVSQSRRAKNYSDSATRNEKFDTVEQTAELEVTTPVAALPKPETSEDKVIRVETDLITIPVRVASRDGRPVPDIQQSEFKIFENGVEQEVAYFSNDEQPFTVALVLDMSYSSVFKLRDIQAAADLFIHQLRGDDRIMIVAFDEKVTVLCEPTNNREALRLAIMATKIGSGTSVYTALDEVINERFRHIVGRKAIVLLSDGVDTSSKLVTAKSLKRDFSETDALVYPIQYDTYDDVRKNRRKDMPVQYDEDDRPYIAERPPGKGEREEDYREADEFLNDIADSTGGRVYKVKSNPNLNNAFSAIAAELRKTYSLGYYPTVERKPGEAYAIKVRVYRPNLIVRARETYLGPSKPSR